MANNFGAKSANLPTPPSFVSLTFRNELEYRNADEHVKQWRRFNYYIVLKIW